MATATTKTDANGKGKLIVSLALSINHQVYTVEPIRSDDPDAVRAWRLTKKQDGDVYDVAQTTHGPACDCGDFEFRHQGQNTLGCKHLQALRLMGMLDPAPCCHAGEPAACVACVDAPAPDNATTTVVDPFPTDGLDPDDNPLDPALWSDECDEFTWELGPDPAASEYAPGTAYTPTATDLDELADWSAEVTAREHLDASERLSLAELAEHQAAFFSTWSNGAGDLFSRIMEELAQRIRFVSAVTPSDFEAREDTIEADARRQWEQVGFQAGRDTCPCRHRAGCAFGHDA